MESSWSPSSWRTKPALQQPDWPDPQALKKVFEKLCTYPPLVFAGESRQLKELIAKAANGEAFVLQAGDCAESFHEFSADKIRDKLKVILQMAVVLTYSLGVPVIKIGRMAGQFAKPRSSPTEKVGDVEIPSFRGHMVNDDAPFKEARIPDPERLLKTYHHSSATLNLLRAFTKGGFADLSQVHVWNQQFIASSNEGKKYEQLAGEIDRALRFMRACGINSNIEALHQVDFFTSHEALILDYEEALTRVDSLSQLYYDCSAHMLWIGNRTKQLNGAHLEFLRGVHNPIGVKVGMDSDPEEIVQIAKFLNPQNEPGRLTIITRMGAKAVEAALPALVSQIKSSGINVAFSCDPMHGNTFVTKKGIKTRHFDDIMEEISKTVAVHQKLDSILSGLHVELTGDDVTECLGGETKTEESHLDINYLTTCDPRLNGRQSIDIAFQVAELMASN